MRALTTLTVLGAIVALACGGGRPIAATEESVARVAGTACLRPILATAVVVGEGQMLTVAHAIAGADHNLSVVELDGTEHAVAVIGFDPQRDLALLQVSELDAPVIQMDEAREGDAGFIMSVSGDLMIERIDYRVTRLVTARSGDIYDEGQVLRKTLELDAETKSGDSGAPLIDRAGRMVGILFARSTGAVTSWALPVDEIDAFLESVTSVAEVDRGRCR